jgi:hypothetical protein
MTMTLGRGGRARRRATADTLASAVRPTLSSADAERPRERRLRRGSGSDEHEEGSARGQLRSRVRSVVQRVHLLVGRSLRGLRLLCSASIARAFATAALATRSSQRTIAPSTIALAAPTAPVAYPMSASAAVSAPTPAATSRGASSVWR